MWAITAQANGASCVYGPFETWEAAWDWSKTFSQSCVTFTISPMHNPAARGLNMAHDEFTGPYILFIEDYEGHSIQHGFHLGTDERLAREIAMEKYRVRVANDLPTVTVALKRDGVLIDTFMGDKWASDY